MAGVFGAQRQLRGQDSVRIRRRHETLANTHTGKEDGWMNEWMNMVTERYVTLHSALYIRG